MKAGSALPKTLLRNTMPAMPSLTLKPTHKAVALRSLSASISPFEAERKPAILHQILNPAGQGEL